MSEFWVFAALMVALPTALMVPIRRSGRIAFLSLGLIFGVGLGLVMELGGPDSPALALPLFGIAVSVSAVLAELIALAWKFAKRRAANG